MIIYKDVFSNDEMASDTYKCKVFLILYFETKTHVIQQIIDDVILEIECKIITCKPGAIDEALLGE